MYFTLTTITTAFLSIHPFALSYDDQAHVGFISLNNDIMGGYGGKRKNFVQKLNLS